VTPRLSFFSSLFPLVFFLSGGRAYGPRSVIDLTHVDFNQPKLHPISGHWQFYWNRLLTAGRFIRKHQPGELIECQ